MPELRWRLRAGVTFGLVLCAVFCGPPTIGAPKAVPHDVRNLIVGRSGWVHDADEAQDLLRVNLADPDDTDATVGLLMMTCDHRGFHIYFTADPGARQKVPEPFSDGFAHFFPDELGSTDPTSGNNVSIYVNFASALAFRSSASAGEFGDPVESLVDFFLSAGRTAALILSPRLSQGRFRPDTRIRFIFEPGADPTALPKDDALAAFRAGCDGRSQGIY